MKNKTIQIWWLKLSGKAFDFALVFSLIGLKNLPKCPNQSHEKGKTISNFVTHTVQCNRKFFCFHSIGSLWFSSVFQLAAAITEVFFNETWSKFPQQWSNIYRDRFKLFPSSQRVAIKLLKCDWLIMLSKPINLGWESSPHQSGKGRKKANH